MQHHYYRRIGLILLAIGLLVFALPGLAQNNTLTYGVSVMGQTNTQQTYTFQGTSGDLVSLYVTSLTAGMQPSLGVIGPNQQQYIAAVDPQNRGSLVAVLSLYVEQTGSYTVSVGSQFGSVGDFVLLAEKHPEQYAGTLVAGTPMTLNFNPGEATPKVVDFMLVPEGVNTLTITTDETFAFSATVRNKFGMQIARLDQNISTIQLNLSPNWSSPYRVSVAPVALKSVGSVAVSLTQSVTPVSPSTSTAPSTTTTTACYDAEFVQDMTLPDGSEVVVGTSYVKTWQLRNTGTCAWDNIAFTQITHDGDYVQAEPHMIPVPHTEPGATVDISMNVIVPAQATIGEPQSAHFQLMQSDGTAFGPVPFVILYPKNP